MSLLVTNGGYGTVGQALQAGIPIVAAGRSEDKAEVCARIAWSGVGLALPDGVPNRANIREAVINVLGDDTFRARANSIARDCLGAETSKRICRIVDDVVKSYAR